MSGNQSTVANGQDEFAWKTQPAAARWVTRTIDSFAARNPLIRRSWPISCANSPARGWSIGSTISRLATTDALATSIGELADVGYVPRRRSEARVWRHPLGMFPPVIVNSGRTGLALRCDSVDAGSTGAATRCSACTPADAEQVIGRRGSMYRHVAIDDHVGCAKLWLVERHGYAGFDVAQTRRRADRRGSAASPRRFATAARVSRRSTMAFDHASRAVRRRGRRHRPRLGLRPVLRRRARLLAKPQPRRPACSTSGRSASASAGPTTTTTRTAPAASRFPQLIATLEHMGFHCRERFYAGREAGWGAQVLEQPECRRRDLRRRRPLARGSGRRLRPRAARPSASSSARSACGASCTARRSSRPACTTSSASSTSTRPARNSRPPASKR